jgi:hypothetical protein
MGSLHQDFAPGWLWKLWDMADFPAIRVISYVKFFAELEKELSLAVTQRGATADLDEVESGKAGGLLRLFVPHCEELGLTTSVTRIGELLFRIEGNISPPRTRNLQLVHAELVSVREQIWRDLDQYRYLYLDQLHRPYYEQEKLFGDDVWGAFESAREDVKDAGSCYALERYTATVFHCMRVVEQGLRALAHAVDVPFGADQWNTVLNNIESKLIEFRKNGIPGISDKIVKVAKLQFYSEAAKEIGYFKDAWRNYVSHGKESYDACQAKSVLNHTDAFMRVLSRDLRGVS